MVAICEFDSPALAAGESRWNPGPEKLQAIRQADHTCSACGLKSREHVDVKSGYLEVLDTPEGEKVLCALCSQAQQLNVPINGLENHGLIIYCPDLSQARISQLVLASAMAHRSKHKLSMPSDLFLKEFKRMLIKPVGECLPGLNTGTIFDMIELLESMSLEFNRNSYKHIPYIKYLPLAIPFEAQLDFWHMATYKNSSIFN